MDVARFMLQKLAPAEQVTRSSSLTRAIAPGGSDPTDHIDSVKERDALAQLAKTDRKRYFEEIRSWGNNRMERSHRRMEESK